MSVSQGRERITPVKDIYTELDIHCIASAIT